MTDTSQYDDDDLITTLDDDEPSEEQTGAGNDDEQASEQAKEETVRKNRFDKKINRLHREKKEALEAMSRERAERENVQAELNEMKTLLGEAQKVKNDNDTIYLKQAMAQALSANDYGLVSEITAKLAEIAQKPVETVRQKEPARQPAQQEPELPELQKAYIEKNADWVDVDFDKTQKADGILHQLHSSGYKADDPQLWVLLDLNLETDDGLFDKNLTKQAGGVLKRLNEAGFSNDNPKIKDLLKANLKKMTAQPTPQTGAVSGKTKNNRITDADKQTMKLYNLNPDNQVHVEEWLKAKGTN